uniref:Uncharacterized protein n=1 Tax=Solanum tuberosum TaxID=4113 RepID=M1DCT5_SOLTU
MISLSHLSKCHYYFLEKVIAEGAVRQPVKGFTVLEALRGPYLVVAKLVRQSLSTGNAPPTTLQTVIKTMVHEGVCGLHLMQSHFSSSRPDHWLNSMSNITALHEGHAPSGPPWSFLSIAQVYLLKACIMTSDHRLYHDPS